MVLKIILMLIFLIAMSGITYAQDPIADTQNSLNVVWTIVAAILVFLMQAGFTALEVGHVRAKNAVNIAIKNIMVFCLGSLAYYFFGFGIMYGDSSGWFGTSNYFLRGTSGEHWNYTFIFFQTILAVTTATITFGSMLERTKFLTYLIASVAICAVIYPVFGGWAWGSLLDGNGWLENLSTGPFIDFAGSSVIHSMGGWLALVGAFLLGPRKGKFDLNGNPRAVPGHNLVLASLGVFILWFSWFGLNGGSTTSGDLSIGRIIFVTNISACIGGFSAMITSWLLFKKPDVSMTLNGVLAGLVSISAGCNTINPTMALIIGAFAGMMVVISVLAVEKKFRIDDPMGAVSVHAVSGTWGTIACGFFNSEAELGIAEKSTGLFYGGGFNQLITQFTGAAAVMIWSIVTGFILFSIIKMTLGLRASEREELIGLDIEEHGSEAYYNSK